MGRDPRKYWAEVAWYKEFCPFFDTVRGSIEQATGLHLHAQDVQNCLCEYDKLCRLRNGEGSVRRYTPSASNSAAPKSIPTGNESQPDKHNGAAVRPTGEDQVVKPVIKPNERGAWSRHKVTPDDPHHKLMDPPQWVGDQLLWTCHECKQPIVSSELSVCEFLGSYYYWHRDCAPEDTRDRATNYGIAGWIEKGDGRDIS